MMKKFLIAFLMLTLTGIGCAPILPPGHPGNRSARGPMPPVPPITNSTEAEMAVEAGVVAIGIGLTILDIILSTQGRRGRGVRTGPMPHPRR